MNKKYITLDYKEYTELLERIEDIETLLSELYNKIKNNEIKEKITNYMTSHGYWI